jgi:hypothetical protein
MTSIDAKNGSPMARRLAAIAARRLVGEGDKHDSDRKPNSAGVALPTVLAPKYATAGAAPEQTVNHNLGMRRDLDTVMAQIAALSGLVHEVFAQQAQQQNNAGMQQRLAAEGRAKFLRSFWRQHSQCNQSCSAHCRRAER